MNDLKETLMEIGCEQKTAELIGELQGRELLKELKKQRSLQLSKIHEEQRKIDRLDDLIRKEEKRK